MPKTNKKALFHWTPDTDQLLNRLVFLYNKKWSCIAKKLEEEMRLEPRFSHIETFPNGKKCNEHWRNKLDPSVNHRPFSTTQIEHILARRKTGIGVSAIAKEFNFAVNDVKNVCFTNEYRKHKYSMPNHPNSFFYTQDNLKNNDNNKKNIAAAHSKSSSSEYFLFPHETAAKELYIPYSAAQLQSSSSESEEDLSPLQSEFP